MKFDPPTRLGAAPSPRRRCSTRPGAASAGILLIIGVLHGVNLLILPIIGTAAHAQPAARSADARGRGPRSPGRRDRDVTHVTSDTRRPVTRVRHSYVCSSCVHSPTDSAVRSSSSPEHWPASHGEYSSDCGCGSSRRTPSSPGEGRFTSSARPRSSASAWEAQLPVGDRRGGGPAASPAWLGGISLIFLSVAAGVILVASVLPATLAFAERRWWMVVRVVFVRAEPAAAASAHRRAAEGLHDAEGPGGNRARPRARVGAGPRVGFGRRVAAVTTSCSPTGRTRGGSCRQRW